MNASFDRFHLVNAYGAFGSMTERRYEVIIEGTLAADPDAADEEEWLPFEFKGKPGDVRRRSRQFAPYHLRLDWQMWFLALRPGAQPWFVALLERLRSGDPAVRRLLRTDPFDGEAPTGIRVRLFEYRYASGPERRETGAWWTRTEAGELARLRSCRRTTVPRSGLRESRPGLSLVPDRSLSPRSPMSAIAVPARRPVLADALAPHRTRLQDAGLVLAGTGVVALLAQITIPLPLVPITRQTLGVILVGAALGSRRGAADRPAGGRRRRPGVRRVQRRPGLRAVPELRLHPRLRAGRLRGRLVRRARLGPPPGARPGRLRGRQRGALPGGRAVPRDDH